ncbi:hypothetical protein D3C87_1496540 [compost metagenome]
MHLRQDPVGPQIRVQLFILIELFLFKEKYIFLGQFKQLFLLAQLRDCKLQVFIGQGNVKRHYHFFGCTVKAGAEFCNGNGEQFFISFIQSFFDLYGLCLNDAAVHYFQVIYKGIAFI